MSLVCNIVPRLLRRISIAGLHWPPRSSVVHVMRRDRRVGRSCAVGQGPIKGIDSSNIVPKRIRMRVIQERRTREILSGVMDVIRIATPLLGNVQRPIPKRILLWIQCHAWGCCMGGASVARIGPAWRMRLVHGVARRRDERRGVPVAMRWTGRLVWRSGLDGATVLTMRRILVTRRR